MDMRKARDIRQRRQRANDRRGWHRVLFLMMLAVVLAGMADAPRAPGRAASVASAGK